MTHSVRELSQRPQADSTRSSLNIAIVRPNHRLGNNILMTALLRDIESRLPQASVEIVTAGDINASLFEGFDQVKAIHTFPSRGIRQPIAMLNTVRQLRKRQFDLAIDPVPRSKSGRFLLSLLKARARLGYRWDRRHRDASLRHALPRSEIPRHMAHMGVKLLRSFDPQSVGDEGANAAPPSLQIRLSTAELASGRALLEKSLGKAIVGHRPVVGLYLHATGKKCYPAPWFLTVIQYLKANRPDMDLVEFTPVDGLSRIGKLLPTVDARRPRELGAALAALDLFVSADCGVMHLARASGTRVVGLFKVTDPDVYAPYGNDSVALNATDDNPLAVAEFLAGR